MQLVDWINTLYFADNQKVLRNNFTSELVGLIFLDPPFNSNANYNLPFNEKSGEEPAAQIHAFEDSRDGLIILYKLVTDMI